MTMALRRLAEIALLKGDLHQAWDICERGLRLAVYPNGKHLPVAGILMAVQGDILRERNDLPAALEGIQDGIELVLRWSELAAIENYLYLARVKRSMGDAPGAQSAIDTARQIADRNEASRIAPFIINLFQVRLWLQLGKVSEAEDWIRDYRPFESYLEQRGFNPKYHYHIIEIEKIAFTRLHLVRRKWDQALAILEPLHAAALDLKRTGSVIEILVLKAVAYMQGSDLERAMGSLGEALRLAEPQGYMRIFIDEGEPMRELLTLFMDESRDPNSRKSRGAVSKYVNQLLAVLTAEIVAETDPGRTGIAEPLSARELDVLRFLATPLTSTEIASELYISPNTARFHIKNIYSKLGVHQRVDAVERAKELGLL
jgi:LuxR family maltose regulon positive regulatory protein